MNFVEKQLFQKKNQGIFPISMFGSILLQTVLVRYFKVLSREPIKDLLDHNCLLATDFSIILDKFSLLIYFDDLR